jgi:hypothetical protein
MEGDHRLIKMETKFNTDKGTWQKIYWLIEQRAQVK